MPKINSKIIWIIAVIVIAIAWSDMTFRLGLRHNDDDYRSQSVIDAKGDRVYSQPTKLTPEPRWENIVYEIAIFPMGYIQSWNEPHAETSIFVFLFGLAINSLLWGCLLVFFIRQVAKFFMLKSKPT